MTSELEMCNTQYDMESLHEKSLIDQSFTDQILSSESQIYLLYNLEVYNHVVLIRSD